MDKKDAACAVCLAVKGCVTHYHNVTDIFIFIINLILPFNMGPDAFKAGTKLEIF
jgi:hypothetical protein